MEHDPGEQLGLFPTFVVEVRLPGAPGMGAEPGVLDLPLSIQAETEAEAVEYVRGRFRGVAVLSIRARGASCLH